MHYQRGRFFGRALLVCGFVFSQICLSRIGANAQQPAIIRTGYETDAHGTIYLMVRLNEKDDARFMLDTGSRTFLSDALVARLKLKTHPLRGPNGEEEKFENGASVQVAPVKISLTNTPITFSEDVMVLPAAIIRNMATECEGIIGVDSLNALSLCLNTNRRQIALVQGGNLAAETLRRLGMDAVKSVPLTVDDNGFYQLPVEVPDG